MNLRLRHNWLFLFSTNFGWQEPCWWPGTSTACRPVNWLLWSIPWLIQVDEGDVQCNVPFVHVCLFQVTRCRGRKNGVTSWSTSTALAESVIKFLWLVDSLDSWNVWMECSREIFKLNSNYIQIIFKFIFKLYSNFIQKITFKLNWRFWLQPWLLVASKCPWSPVGDSASLAEHWTNWNPFRASTFHRIWHNNTSTCSVNFCYRIQREVNERANASVFGGCRMLHRWSNGYFGSGWSAHVRCSWRHCYNWQHLLGYRCVWSFISSW